MHCFDKKLLLVPKWSLFHWLEIFFVDGGWGQWTSWSSCSKTCESGVSTRTRLCNRPRPLPGGQPCYGNATDTRPCNTQNCSAWGIRSANCDFLRVLLENALFQQCAGFVVTTWMPKSVYIAYVWTYFITLLLNLLSATLESTAQITLFHNGYNNFAGGLPLEKNSIMISSI